MRIAWDERELREGYQLATQVWGVPRPASPAPACPCSRLFRHCRPRCAGGVYAFCAAPTRATACLPAARERRHPLVTTQPAGGGLCLWRLAHADREGEGWRQSLSGSKVAPNRQGWEDQSCPLLPKTESLCCFYSHAHALVARLQFIEQPRHIEIQVRLPRWLAARGKD